MGRHSRPDGHRTERARERSHEGGTERAHEPRTQAPHLVPVAQIAGRHRAGFEGHVRNDDYPTYRGRHLARTEYLPEIDVDPGYYRAGLTPAEARYYEGKHVREDDEYPSYEGRHRARHEDGSRSGARRAMVATTIATTLTAGGIAGALWQHGGEQQDRALRPRPVTKLADARAQALSDHVFTL